MMKKFFVPLFFFVFSFSIFAEGRVISPAKGVWANKQPLVLDIRDGAECFYSLTGASPLDSGFAYDGPVLLDAEGDVELRVTAVKDGKSEEYSVKYNVRPQETEVFSSGSEEALFFKTVSENPVQDFSSTDGFPIPEKLKYSLSDSGIFLDGGILSIDESSRLFRTVACSVTDGEAFWRFVIRIAGVDAGTFTRREIPFEFENWETIKFTGKKLIWKIDNEYWSANSKPVKIDRSIPHTLYWQDVAYDSNNPVSNFVLPPLPRLSTKDGGSSPVIFKLAGDQSYKMQIADCGIQGALTENDGLFSEIVFDTLEGDSIETTAVFSVFCAGVFQGTLSAPYVLDRLPPEAPKIFSSEGNVNFSRKSVEIKIEGEKGAEIFFAVSDGEEVDGSSIFDEYALAEKTRITKVGSYRTFNPEEFPVLKSKIADSDNSKSIFYKVCAYAVDQCGNRSKISTYSIVIDENNFYLSEKGSDDGNGSMFSPFASFEKILQVVNSGEFTRIYVDGAIPVNVGETKIERDCEFIGQKKARLIFSPETSIKVSNACAIFSNCILEKQKDESGRNSSSDFLIFENAVTTFSDCEVVGFFLTSGDLIKADSTVVRFENSGFTSEASVYTCILLAKNSQISIFSSRTSTVAPTSVNFSVTSGRFEIRGSTCKVSGNTGRICELTAVKAKISDNVFEGKLEKSNKGLNPIFTDDKTSISENKGNVTNGF